MAEQTRRAGPWESNLGLEPEWDGASGLWWPVECDQLPEKAKNIQFSGSIIHEEHTCKVNLFAQLSTSLVQNEILTVEPELIEPSLWHAHIELPNEQGKSEVLPITVYGHLFRGGFKFSSQASGLKLYRLVPQWIIQGAHIPSIDVCKFDKMIMYTNTLPGLLPDRIHAYFFLNRDTGDDDKVDFDKIDIKEFVKANSGKFEARIHSPIGENLITLNCDFKRQIGTSVQFEPTNSINFSFPQPLPILNDNENEPTPLTCLWNWADWLIGMFEMIGNTPTSTAKIYSILQEHTIRLYMNLKLARQEHSKDKVANKIRLDPVDEQNTTSRWNLLLQEWLNAWNLDSHWFIAVDYLRHFLRLAGEDSPGMVPYFLFAVQSIEARWFAEFGEYKPGGKDKYTTIEIVESTLDRADILSEDLKNSVGSKFNSKTASKVITTIRNEFTHPATKDKRTKLRELLWSTNGSEVYFLAELLISAALKLIKKEVCKDYISSVSHSRNRYLELYDKRYRLHLRRWRELKKACSA